jgi:hypothetical protein
VKLLEGSSLSTKIALVGIYGGLIRDYNPGCFMIAHQTVSQLHRRIPGAKIDVYSIDMAGRYHDVQIEVERGFAIHFCSAIHQLELLDSRLMSYDALVIGGDNVWMANEDLPADDRSNTGSRSGYVFNNNIFFLNSPRFLAVDRPIVAVNCASCTSKRETVLADARRFVRACNRSRYVAVRSQHLQHILDRDLAIRGVRCFPDPVFGVDPDELSAHYRPFRLPRTRRPRFGIAIRPSLADALIEALHQCGNHLERFEIWLYPFSRLHWHLESVLRMKKAFGKRLHYIERYLGPIDSFQLIQNFDVSMTDTYHGTVAAILHRKPFISVRFHDLPESRRGQLFLMLGVEDRSIRLRSEGLPPTDYDGDVQALVMSLSRLIDDPQIVPEDSLSKVRTLTEQHFTLLADAISDK